jgi:hypothetical protein
MLPPWRKSWRWLNNIKLFVWSLIMVMFLDRRELRPKLFYLLLFLGWIVVITTAVNAGTKSTKECVAVSAAPQCPKSGTTILDERYPAQGYVVSLSPYADYDTTLAEDMPLNFIYEVITGHSQRTPDIIVPTKKEGEFLRIKEDLRTKFKRDGRSDKDIDQILTRVVRADTSSYTWQQDYFQSTISPETGRPVLREIVGYSDVRPSTKGAVQAMVDSSKTSCPISKGDGIPPGKRDTKGRQFGNGAFGGNLEALPGEVCMFGNNEDYKGFADSFCGSSEHSVQLNVSWLTVGHVDEVIKVVPAPNKKAPCNFTLMYASPKKALELLAKKPNKKFLDFSHVSDPDTLDSVHESRASEELTPGRLFCSIFQDHVGPERSIKSSQEQPAGQPQEDRGQKVKVRGAWYYFQKLVSSAHAGINLASQPGDYEEKDCDELQTEIVSMTNQEMLDGVKANQELYDYNMAIEKIMIANRDKAINAISNAMPECTSGSFTVLPVPDLFTGSSDYDDSGNLVPDESAGDSILPNPTNSVVAGNKVIFPHPQNGAFKDYLTAQMKKDGLKAGFVDTWEYAHLGLGNLHCSTQALRYCNPSK